MLTIRRAREDEGAALSELCLRSKAVWGYDNAFMQACRRELILTNAAVRSPDIRVADHNGQPVGVVELRFNNEEAELEKLFVEPAMMKTGVGRQLLDWAIEAARAKGATVLDRVRSSRGGILSSHGCTRRRRHGIRIYSRAAHSEAEDTSLTSSPVADNVDQILRSEKG